MKKDKEFLELFIFGRVQGVYFRKTIKKYAEKLKIYGSIENLANGSVHVIVYAHRDLLEIFLNLCYKGSLFSQIEKIEIKYLSTYTKVFTKFTIIKKDSFLIDQVKSFTHLKKNI